MKTWQKLQQGKVDFGSYLMREKVIDGLRSFFKAYDFHEVETPLLVKHPGTEPYLEVFPTELKVEGGKEYKGYLLTSPEYAMKKLLVAGLPKIFTICKSFRNGEGLGEMHNHEFTILEWYRADADYTDIMSDCELIFRRLAKSLKGSSDKVNYQGKKYDLSTPFPKFTVAQLFEKYLHVNKDQLVGDDLVSVAKEHDLNADNWDDAFNLLLMNFIEPEISKINAPVFIYEYPVQQAALSKKCASDPRFAERFELFFAGVEIANAFSELTDAKEQATRFQAELQLRKELGKEEYQMDQDFIDALEVGMPESGGVALGVDRLIMIFADVPNIKQTLFFPIEEVFDLK